MGYILGSCPEIECDGQLELQNTDSRQEWSEEEYECNECHKTFFRKIAFKTQSSLVESDTLYDENYKEVG